MSKNIKIIPRSLHFIWIGDGVEKYKENLTFWRSYHPDYDIFLWVSTHNSVSPEWRDFLKKQKINLKFIQAETRLRNYRLILQEINQHNAWSASDILRISILLLYPGFYFDINIMPIKALPSNLFSTEGLLFCINVEYLLKYNNIALNYKLLAAAEKDQPLLIKASIFIRKNFEYLAQNSSLVKDFFALSALEEEKKYFFAVFVTGRALSLVLRNYYFYKDYLTRESQFDIELLLLDNLFLQSYLNIPLPQGALVNRSIYKLFENKMFFHGNYLSFFEKIENTSLVRCLNTLVNTLQFSTLLDEKGYTYASAKIENDSQKREMDSLKKDLEKVSVYSGLALIGKNKFFVLPDLNKLEQAENIQKFLKNKS